MQTGLIDGTQLLIRHGKVNLDHMSSRGSVLHIAVRQKDFKMCQILLLANSSLIDSIAPGGESVFDIETSQGVQNMLK